MSLQEELDLLRIQEFERELAKREYSDYLAYVQGDMWKRTSMSEYIAEEVQRFLETETDHAYDILIIESPPQHGKLCADSTPVPTPMGWKRHGDLRVGDEVFGPDGRPVQVTDLIPQEQPASKLVTFSDGAQIKVHPNHEWVVFDRCTKTWHTLETKQMESRGLRQGPKGRGGRYKFQVLHNVCVEYPEAEQALHPYFLGLWLGDGHTSQPTIVHSPKDTESIERLISLGYEVTFENIRKKTGVLTTGFYGRGYQELKSLGFGFSGGAVKHIPDNYKIASVEQRLELLAGMIDSDGYVHPKTGRVTISNANKRLIDDFAEVVRSLGWRATVAAFAPKTSSSGFVGKQTVYQLTFNPTLDIPTALPRKKLSRLNPVSRMRAVVSIEDCEPEHGQCITVDGGVYLVGKQFTPTHNSMTVTETLPSWYLGNHPRNNVILASYNKDFAEKFCRRNKEKIRALGADLFGVTIGSIDRADEFELDNGLGRLISRGLMSGITGNPANLIIIDDPIKNREEADSPTYRNKVWEEWQSSLKSRLAAKAKVILILTPWHEDDIASRMLANEPNVRLLRLPIEAEKNDPLGREIGDSLCPELGKDKNWLRDFKASYINDPRGGQRAWTALYQCSPRVEGGNLVRRDWWRFYDPDETRMYGTEIISVDAAFKDSDTSDYVAIEVWGKHRQDYYLLACINKHLNFPATVQAIKTVRQLYPNARTVLIEDKANGSAIIQTLQREMYCIPINPQGGKVARVNAISAAIESGHVFLPDPAKAPWVTDFIDQFTAFPSGAHDDMVDSASQALNRMIYNNGEFEAPVISETEQLVKQEEDDFNNPNILFNPYGVLSAEDYME